jgi:hypothetical protein
MIKTIVISALVLVAAFGNCGHLRNQNTLVGYYDLKGKDYSGRVIFNGSISFTSLENTDLSGICKVVKVSETFNGTVNKDGPCEGKVSGGKVTIYLSPTLSDGGLVFEGDWSEGRIAGTWRIESFAGAKTLGTFEAARK